MARLEYIQYDFYDSSLDLNGELIWEKKLGKKSIKDLPQIYWTNNSGWDEANLWALDRATSGTVDIETVKRTMKHLGRFATFAETECIDWRHFPLRKEEQVLRKFRSHLIRERDTGMAASSTVSNCMNAVIQFYRFANLHNLIGNTTAMWNDRQTVIRTHDRTGFERAMIRLTTDLKIPNRKRIGATVEDGLLPLRSDHMRALLAYSAERETQELHLMLGTGFLTGARIGTITTLTVTCLQTARSDPFTPGIHLLPVGPGTGISTKFSVIGELMVPEALLADLKAYASSTTRLLREAKARDENKNLLFLARSGRPYSVATVNRLVDEMRKRAAQAGMHFMGRFIFHQSRATFGTWLMQLLLEHTSPTIALGIVRDAMLHKDESTTLGYIKFIESTRAKKDVAAAFSTAFTGLENRNWNEVHA
jgi:integrase